MAGKELTLEYLQEIIQAFNTRDADKIISYFAEDCIFYASRGPDVDGQAITGKEALPSSMKVRQGGQRTPAISSGWNITA